MRKRKPSEALSVEPDHAVAAAHWESQAAAERAEKEFGIAEARALCAEFDELARKIAEEMPALATTKRERDDWERFHRSIVAAANWLGEYEKKGRLDRERADRAIAAVLAGCDAVEAWWS